MGLLPTLWSSQFLQLLRILDWEVYIVQTSSTVGGIDILYVEFRAAGDARCGTPDELKGSTIDVQAQARQNAKLQTLLVKALAACEEQDSVDNAADHIRAALLELGF